MASQDDLTSSVTISDQNTDDDDFSASDGTAATVIPNNGTSSDVDDDPDERIKLQQPINYPDLLNSRGVYIVPELNDSDSDELEHRTFDPEIVTRYFETNFNVSSDEDGEDDVMPFDRRAEQMIDIVEGGAIKKKMITPGLESSGSIPDRAFVTIDYCLFLDGADSPFDSTRLRGCPEKIKLDCGKIICGLEVAIKSMKQKENSHFLISPEYAFGDLGCPNRIPPRATIYAKIELINFADETEAEALLMLDPEERNSRFKFESILKIAGKEHVTGNQYYERKEWKLAAKAYKHGCKLLEDVEMANDYEESRQKRLLNKLYLNLSQCFLKLLLPRKACIVLAKALNIDNRNLKANFRMGVAKKALGNYSDSRKYLERALRIDPTNADVIRQMVWIDKQVKMERENELVLCARMLFGGSAHRPSAPQS